MRSEGISISGPNEVLPLRKVMLLWPLSYMILSILDLLLTIQNFISLKNVKNNVNKKTQKFSNNVFFFSFFRFF